MMNTYDFKHNYCRNIVEYWHLICTDGELTGILLEHFLQILSSSCLYEPNEPCVDRQKIASVQPFAIFCALHKMMPCKDVKEVCTTDLLISKFLLFINYYYIFINLATEIKISGIVYHAINLFGFVYKFSSTHEHGHSQQFTHFRHHVS